MKLFYRHFGEGQPVIILHGIFGVSDNWVTIARKIAEQFSVYLLDLRNHGQSPHSDTFNYVAMMDDLSEFIADHQLKNPIIIGHSMGGKVAMYFALEYPESVNSLMVVDISLRKYPPRHGHQQMIETMQSVDFSKVTTREDVDKQLQEGISSKPIRQFIMKNLVREGQNTFKWRLNLQVIYDNLENIFEGVEHFNRYEKPTLFVRGEKSDYVLDSDFDKIYRHFPEAEIETVSGASHWIHAEAPDELCAIISDFTGKTCEFRPGRKK
ncbi:MAG: alpha/beta fold hydrolase [Bacteroidales bacterium]|nr:alpha/beta fold hydrolase [Bacteroidales bacterium]MCF8338929.1 alpha/beta fold hydrolase [Bacteroidales bacterium]